jgi:hypothetical protein
VRQSDKIMIRVSQVRVLLPALLKALLLRGFLLSWGCLGWAEIRGVSTKVSTRGERSKEVAVILANRRAPTSQQQGRWSCRSCDERKRRCRTAKEFLEMGGTGLEPVTPCV